MESASTSRVRESRLTERDKDHLNGHDGRVFSDQSRPDRVLERKNAILVMGCTGSGKSSLIATMIGASVEVGHSLKSCMPSAAPVRPFLDQGLQVPRRVKDGSILMMLAKPLL